MEYLKTNNGVLFKGDCLQIIKEIPNSTIDLIITSPPYNLTNTSGGGFKKGEQKRTGKWSGGALANGYIDHSDKMDRNKYIEWQKMVLIECWRIIKNDGAIFYNHKPRIQNGILQTPFELNPNLPVRQVIIWYRKGGINFSPTFYLPTHEWIIIFAKEKFRLRDKKASGAKDVWEIKPETNNPHPAPFPIELPKIILETTNGKLILDPFMGSGTTAIAAEIMNKQWIGIEKSKIYCEQTYKRLKENKYFPKYILHK